jgi:hypothetical protein
MFSQVAHDTLGAAVMVTRSATRPGLVAALGALKSRGSAGVLPSDPTTTSRALIPPSNLGSHPRPWPCWRMRGRVTFCRSQPWWIAQCRAGLYRESWAVQPSWAQVRVSPKARTIGPAPAARRLPLRIGTAMLGLFPHPSRRNASRPRHAPPVDQLLDAAAGRLEQRCRGHGGAGHHQAGVAGQEPAEPEHHHGIAATQQGQQPVGRTHRRGRR